MEDLTAYLNDSLIPLELKIKEYLNLERDIRNLEVEKINLKAQQSTITETTNNFAKDELTTSSDQKLKENNKLLENLLQNYEQKKTEIINMLPERDKFIEIDLGYGPSMVGYFTVDMETHQTLPEPLLRVVH